MAHGGKRPGAGAKKGQKHASTLSKEAAREALRQVVLHDMRELAAAQIANAKGIKFLVVRQKSTGKFVRVTEAMAKLRSGEEADHEIIEVWEKDPSVQAFTDLMNRALDKPKEQEQELRLTGDEPLIAALLQGRKRAAEARKS